VIGHKLADRYEVTSELGRGGMGVVYRARDPRLSRDVAVKVITPAVLSPDAEERFKSEAQVVAQMDHPSIVPIFDFGHHEESLFFVMPIVEGTSLQQLIRDESLVLGDVLDFGISVAEALAYSHARGVVHRDIKPENIMILHEERGGSRVRVMDFGLARRTQVTALTRTGVIVGTVSYASPEQVGGQDIDGRSDIYSLGTVLYHCVTSVVPFTGELQSVLYRIVHEIPQSPRELGAEIDEELEAIILSCLAKDPRLRPQTVVGLMESLQDFRDRLRDSDRMKSVMVSRAAAVSRPATAPFVNRVEELKELQHRLNDAIGGECQFVVVSGEPGVGKSRLLDELEGLARAREIRVLHGRFVERDTAFPHHGFCELIQEYFRRKETSSSPSAQPDLSDLGADLVSLFPMLGEIDAVRSSASGGSHPRQADESSPLDSQTQIFELLARTLTRLAGGRPLVLLLEDLHGAEASVEALQYIVRRLGPTPTLIVATYRSSEIGRRHPLARMLEGFRGDRRFASIALGPFSPSAHRQYVATLVGGSQVGDHLVDELYEASEGNPFFAKELLRSLLDSGNIAQDDSGSWVLSGERAISSDTLPATIQQAVETRIGRLPDELREILSIAAVMGKTFEFRDLEKLAEGKGDMDEAVDALVQEGLIEEEPRSRKGDRLTFSSGVVREVLYGELSRRRRRSLHRKYAHEIEKRFGGRLDRVYPQLLHHFSEGNVPEKTVEYGLLHAKKSFRAFGAEETIRATKTALEFLDEEWEGNRAIEGEARMMLAAGYRMSGDVNGALREIDAAIRIFEREEQTNARCSALLFAAKVAWQARRMDETRRWVDQGMEAARNAGMKNHLRQFLSLAATLASLRGMHTRAARYRVEVERIGAGEAEAAAKVAVAAGGRLVVALANPIVASEPAKINLLEEAEVHSNAYESLVATDEDGNLMPSLAEKWESKDDGRAFHFKLRPNVRFHDGHALTATDVKDSFERSARRVCSALPPGFAAIHGVVDFAEKRADDLSGVIAHADDRLEIRLKEPLPIYPSLLSDPRMAVTRPSPDAEEGEPLLGTGPFRLRSRDRSTLVFERSADHWKGVEAKVDAVEFRHFSSAAGIASGLRSGEIDLARDLLPGDLEEFLRDPRYRGRVVEVPQKNTYFVLFNSHTSLPGRVEALRRALSGVVNTTDLVWRTLGRFARPAAGFLPPGILGHDPGRRSQVIDLEEARELLRSSGLAEPVRLKAAVHPLFQDRHESLFQALVSVWGQLGVEISIEISEMESFLRAWTHNDDLDMLMGRWIADYDDPDNFTHALFNSETGIWRNYFSSAEADEILEKARAETNPSAREGLYRKFERLLLGAAYLIPLHHDVDYRVAGPKVRGIRLSSVPPHVNYSEVGKQEKPAASPRIRHEASGIILVPMTGQVTGLDPALSHSAEQDEVLPSIYETLTRDVGEAQIVPWLAAEFRSEEGGRRYRIRLRDNVSFHDGRRLTARDVRYSFERLLQHRESRSRWRYSSIKGARAILDGETSTLSGFNIVSAEEFTIDLERPVSVVPGMMSFSAAAILPEGTAECGSDWRHGSVGTGPFRVRRFEPGRLLELERNPHYWREGYPRSRGLTFTFRVPPREILSGFRSGRFSLASDLYPEDVRALRRESRYAAGYKETPCLSTYYLAFNTHRGPLAERSLRRRIVRALNVPKLVRQTLGKVAIPAHGLIPPGLLGYEPPHRAGVAYEAPPTSSVDVELSAAIHPVFTQEYAEFFDHFRDALGEVGVRIRPTDVGMAELLEGQEQVTVDLALVQWVADFPDADTFVQILQSSAGFIGPLCGSPEIDSLVERGRDETDSEARHAVYRRIEEITARDVRLLPLFHEQVYRFARPEIEGLTVACWSPPVAYENLRVRGR
jgi:ABC-type transport system substrate-binding protein